VRVTVTYLQATDPATLARPSSPRPTLELERVTEPDPDLNRGLYTAVGGDWQWTDRLPWTRAAWQTWLAVPGRETWLARVGGEIAGYAELAGEVPVENGAVTDGGTDVEIVYFGLLPEYAGRGLGGHVLADVMEQAWSLPDRWPGLSPTRRVWLHTCSLDSPRALANYRARGLEVYRTAEIEQESVVAVP
jgi:ribosomal protein S18 acetylase RimI-like enzyme